jgi:putative ATPase
MKGVGYGQGYRYVHDDPTAREEMPCLPERFADRDYLTAVNPDAILRADDEPHAVN